MYKLFLMWRYLTRRALSLVAVVALTLSVGALVVAPSIMSGFQEEFYARIRGTLSDMTLRGGRPHSIPQDSLLEIEMSKLPHVQALAPYVETPALDKHLREVDYCFVRGVDPVREAEVSKFDEYLLSPREILEEVSHFDLSAKEALDVLTGTDADPELREAYESFYPKEADTEQIHELLNNGTGDDLPTCLVGLFYLRYYRVNIGETIILTTASANGEISEEREFKIVGAFKTGVSQKDRRLVITSLKTMQEFGSVEGRVTGYSFKLSDYEKAMETRKALRSLLLETSLTQENLSLRDENIVILTWEQHNEQLIKAVKMEELLIWLMTLLIVVAASATIFLVLFMSVHTKVREIGILRAMGATSQGVLGLFVSQGLVLALIGILFGYVLGNLIGWNLNQIADGIDSLTGWHPFPPEVYYIDKIPYKPSPTKTALNISITLCLGMLAAVIPGLLAALRPPLKAIRHD